MTLRVAAAALAVFALAGPVMATRHADVVYLQQFKARQKQLSDAAKAKSQAAGQQVAVQEAAKAPAATPARGKCHRHSLSQHIGQAIPA